MRVPPRFADGWPEDPAAFAVALREARQAAGVSQNFLASLAGYSETTIRNIETDRYAASGESRRRLIEALANARNRKAFPLRGLRPNTPNPSAPDAVPTDEEEKDEP